MRALPTGVERRRRITTRALPLVAIAIAAFAAGIVVGSEPPPEKAAAERFVNAWARQDYAAMHAELNPAARRRHPVDELRRSYLDAQETSTLETIDPSEPGDPESQDGAEVVSVPLRVATIAFGSLEEDLELPFADGGIDWSTHLTFPGVAPGEQLTNDIELGRRGPILARRGTPLATGPPEARSSPLGSAAIDVTGEVGQADPSEVDELAREGYPVGTPVGVSGLERAFNSHLAGKPGGSLIAAPAGGGSGRVLAQSEPRGGEPLRTTIDTEVQTSAVAALAGRSGGVAVLDARDGSVRALAGTAFSSPQPPGSTFKVVTTTAALQAGVVSLDEQFPVVDGINVGGRFIANAHDELCGGSFVEAFAQSCNSVFAPLGPEIGEERLVTAAERFGFNSKPTLYDAEATAITDPPESSIPEDIGDDLDLGVSAIGQGEVLATPLEMASISQTVADRGIRAPTPIVKDPALQSDAEPVRVMSAKIAAQLRDLMIGVVTSGTGTAAALSGIQVAGKTGTAELGPDPNAPPAAPGEDPPQLVDAWFTAFAPAQKPRLAVGVMLIDADADGGEVAAPIAAQVLATGLG